MKWLCFNGTFFNSDQPVISAGNKSYRYGDGFFETLRVHQSHIPLKAYHKKRIVKSLALLNYTLPDNVTIDLVFEKLLELCALNRCNNSARVRLSFSHGDGTLFENKALHYLIEADAFPPPAVTRSAGLFLGVFDAIRKEISPYSGLKLASGFIYSRAAQYCAAQQLDDVIILNTYGRLIESVISNIFWIRDGQLFTPPVNEGCVEGVFRSYLLNNAPLIVQQPCTTDDLKNAEELFLTNALRGIRSVQSFQGALYRTQQTQALLQQHLSHLFP
ncbi:aminotransferase class IV [Niabella ginsenosidivorans]|uniref:branched-chain-amino-acid transaminase n=1 Tax=Niabella ginsenosidivorans TaxID=1176587 RepID=A0A1A9HZI3_9BACT|nr:aminotransferase class IV [Niabella ginsenosidivorans]ANH79880.1 aminotransferase class IV [Niabella ginsenosidivorans]